MEEGRREGECVRERNIKRLLAGFSQCLLLWGYVRDYSEIGGVN